MKRKLLIIQPRLPSYRVTLFNELAELNHDNVTVFAGENTLDYGVNDESSFKFSYEQATWKRFLHLFSHDWATLKLWRAHDVTLHFADVRFFSLWLLSFLSLFSSKRFYMHGQGGYKSRGLLVNCIYTALVFISDGYICYTEYSKTKMLSKIPRFLHKKVSVCANTLKLEPVTDVLEKNTENTLLYIGRLREGCDIDVLLSAASKANVKVKVIGIGEPGYMEAIRKKFASTAIFYGAVFDEDEQRKIASTCMAGAYGGDAGLSVVHYMALGLPVIVHGDIDNHMGPEPSYVVDGYNGLVFERKNASSMAEKISVLVGDDNYRHKLALGALQTFNDLAKPSMAEKFMLLMGLSK